MERLNFKLAASAVMIICAANGAQVAAGGQQEVNAQSNHNGRFDDFDRLEAGRGAVRVRRREG